jgi:alpha-ketoglutarate-dependent taurine dioxygenase
MNIKPLNVLGAEVSNIDLKSLSSRDSNEIQDAIDQYKVLFFRDQDLDGDELCNPRYQRNIKIFW